VRGRRCGCAEPNGGATRSSSSDRRRRSSTSGSRGTAGPRLDRRRSEASVRGIAAGCRHEGPAATSAPGEPSRASEDRSGAVLARRGVNPEGKDPDRSGSDEHCTACGNHPRSGRGEASTRASGSFKPLPAQVHWTAWGTSHRQRARPIPSPRSPERRWSRARRRYTGQVCPAAAVPTCLSRSSSQGRGPLGAGERPYVISGD
jgi:hypothetical protein